MDSEEVTRKERIVEGLKGFGVRMLKGIPAAAVFVTAVAVAVVLSNRK